MALSALIHKSKTVTVATLTIATIATKDTETPATVAKVATVTVANPTKSKNPELLAEDSGLSACDRQKLLAYLDAIGETDQDIINEYLTECGKDAETLARELQQANECLQIKTGEHSGLVQCSGCRHLSGDTCQFHGWRVVVDKWRRCTDFELLQKTPVSKLITCKGCYYFQSYNDHGGAAGACGAGVMPVGACHWADTAHDCQQWSQA
jgi:hypothetical protein